MLTRVFNPDPAARPSVKDLLSEPWLTSCTLTPMDVKKELLMRKDKILRVCRERKRDRLLNSIVL